MKTPFQVALPVLAITSLLFSASVPQAQEDSKTKTLAPEEVAGQWQWTTESRRDPGVTRTSTLSLNLKDGKLTGVISGSRGDREIDQVSIKGDTLNLAQSREFQGNTFKSVYSGKVDGDVIKGNMTGTFGDRTFEREWEARRVVKLEGEWDFSIRGTEGNVWEAALEFEKGDDGYTGKIVADEWSQDFKDVKLDGSKVTYTSEYERDGRTMTLKNSAKVRGDRLIGKVEGVRDGEPWSREWKAVRK